MKFFISQPMANKTDAEIKDTINEVKHYLSTTFDVVEIIDSYFEQEPNYKMIDQIALWFLGRSITKMAEADMVVFCTGWDEARGCQIEYECARKYHIPILMLEID